VQDGNLAHVIFPPQWDDVIHDELVLDQDRNIARASFAPRWDDFI
jgi:hypothetical protein